VQVAPLAHTQPHVPQWASSVLRFTHAPSQTDWPVGHWQTPEVQVAPVAHVVGHAPQWDSSLARSTQVEPHVSGSVAGHVHVPASQTSFVSGQTFPHAAAASVPQLRGSSSPSTQRGSGRGTR